MPPFVVNILTDSRSINKECKNITAKLTKNIFFASLKLNAIAVNPKQNVIIPMSHCPFSSFSDHSVSGLMKTATK